MSIHLISYGNGDKFDPEVFRPIRNTNFLKPEGGLWGSPKYCNYGWKDWCEGAEYGDLSTYFEFMYEGRTLVIDSQEDLSKLPWLSRDGYLRSPDYEAMLNQGVDAIYLTEKGERETRFSFPSLYGYDCECVLVMNPDCITSIEEALKWN